MGVVSGSENRSSAAGQSSIAYSLRLNSPEIRPSDNPAIPNSDAWPSLAVDLRAENPGFFRSKFLSLQTARAELLPLTDTLLSRFHLPRRFENAPERMQDLALSGDNGSLAFPCRDSFFQPADGVRAGRADCALELLAN